MENLDHHGGAVPSSYNDQQRSNNSNIKSGNSGSKSGNSGSAENSQTGGQSGNNVKPSQVSRRNRQENQKQNPETENHHNPDISGSATTATGQRKSSSSSSSKKENRKSTPAMTGNGNSSHGSHSRQQQQQQATSGEKSGSGGKRRDHPSGVGAVGGRGSILHNTVNPLLTEMHRSYTHHRSSSETHDSIEELRNAFELAERSSPGITEHFIQLIFTRLHPNGSEDRARSYVDRLTRVTKS
jgi:serine/threonine-protein kinase 24/25/MST4